jgi:alpha-galactosidase
MTLSRAKKIEIITKEDILIKLKNRIRIAYIGGGSTGWAPILMNDLAVDQELAGEVVLYDIDFPRAKMNETYGNWLQKRPGVNSKFIYRAAKRIGEALKGADFVVCSITPGPLGLMKFDLDIPRKYGILQTVGDTVGPGGVLRSMRAVPVYREFADAFRHYCPKAWIINYTNPMTVLTRTLLREEPALKVFGCCHEVFGTQNFLGRLAAEAAGRSSPMPRDEIRTNVFGINHFTWIDKAVWGKRDLFALVRRYAKRTGIRRRFGSAEISRQLKKANGEPWGVNNRQVTYELFDRYGILPAAGDRHLAEFVPGFLSGEKEMHRWGITNTGVGFRLGMVKKRILRQKQDMKNPMHKPKPSGEEGVKLIKALMGLGNVESNVNLGNRGQIENLPWGAVVETNALFSHDKVNPVKAGALPAGVHGLVERHCLNQELLVDAAFKQDLHLCFQAFKNDPLMTLPMDRAYELFDKMVQATRNYLKGYK